MDSTFDFIAGLFFSFLFIKLIRVADSNPSGKLDVETFFLLDEFPNIGKIPDFEKKLSTMRSRGVNTSIIFQSIAQLKNRYPNDVYQEILGNCDTKICLGCSEMIVMYQNGEMGKNTQHFCFQYTPSNVVYILTYMVSKSKKKAPSFEGKNLDTFNQTA